MKTCAVTLELSSLSFELYERTLKSLCCTNQASNHVIKVSGLISIG